MEKDVYIVCSGASLSGFNFELLKDKKVIAVNYACFNIPHFDYVSAIDFDFYENNEEAIKKINKPFYAMENYHYREIFDKLNVNLLTHSGEKGCDKRKGFVKHGYNSGYFAVQLALDLGYKNIHLLGMDACYDGGNVYYFNDNYIDKNYQEKNVYSHLPNYMKALKTELQKDIKIYNYSEISIITCFEKRSLNSIK